MTLFTAGIRIAFDAASIGSGEPRLFLNEGTRRVTNWQARGIPYASPAFLPKGDWHVATERERQLLAAHDGHLSNDGSTIWIIKMSDPFMALLAPHRERLAASREVCESVCDTPEYLETQSRAVLELGPYFRSSERIRVLGTCVKEPGLMTSTTRTVEGVQTFPGLHIDGWDGAPVESRARCRSKISINIGWEDRFFLFINRPAAELVAGAVVMREDYQLGRDFMERYPSYPVVRVRIRPGEAYIAPTDNMIHDGTTEGMGLADVTLNVLGYVGPAR